MKNMLIILETLLKQMLIQTGQSLLKGFFSVNNLLVC